MHIMKEKSYGNSSHPAVIDFTEYCIFIKISKVACLKIS